MSIERICSSTCNCSWRNLFMDVFRVCCFPNLLRQFKFLSLVIRNGFMKEIPDRMEEMKAAPSLSQHLPWRQKIVIFSSLKLVKVSYVCGRGWLYVAKMVLHLAWPKDRFPSLSPEKESGLPTDLDSIENPHRSYTCQSPLLFLNLQSCLQLPHQNVSRQLPFAITSENRDAMIGLRFP